MKNICKKLTLTCAIATVMTSAFAIVLIPTFVPAAWHGAGITSVAHAADGEYTLLEAIPEVGPSGATMKTTANLTTYIQDAINLMIALAAMASVFMIVWGGLLYMTSESIGKKNDGLDKVKNAVYGLLLVLSTVLLLRTINPKLIEIAKIEKIKGLAMISPQSLVDQLQAETDQLNADANGSYDRSREALASLKTLKTQLGEAQLQADLACANSEYRADDELCNQLKANVVKIQNDIASTTASVAVGNHETITSNSLAIASNILQRDTSRESIVNDTNTIVTSIDNTTAKKIQQLRGLNATGEIVAVQNQGEYAKAFVRIEEAVAQMRLASTNGTGNTQKPVSLKNIDQIVQAYSSQPNITPALLEKIKTKQQSAINTVKSTTIQ